MLNISSYDILLATNNLLARDKIELFLSTFFQLIPCVDPVELQCLNWRIIQSEHHISMDRSDHVIKMYKFYFKKSTPEK